jgi:hypothetical protein
MRSGENLGKPPNRSACKGKLQATITAADLRRDREICLAWLNDRPCRSLPHDDLEHYGKVITALSETIRLMAEIDAAIPKWPIE